MKIRIIKDCHNLKAIGAASCLQFLLFGAISILITGCATPLYTPTAADVPSMTKEEAQNRLKGLAGLDLCSKEHISKYADSLTRGPIRDVRVEPDRVDLTYEVRRLFGTTRYDHTLYFKDIINVSSPGGGFYYLNFQDGTRVLPHTEKDAIALAQAFYSLLYGKAGSRSAGNRASAGGYIAKTDPVAEKAFPEVVRLYRASPTKPELPEEAHKFDVQGDFAVEKNKLPAAVDRYTDALKLAPWWPLGYLKRGQALAGLEAYEAAIRDMKNFLLLAPEVKEARMAQDNIYKWESTGTLGASRGITTADSGSGGAVAYAGQLSGQYVWVHHVMAIPYTTHKNVSFTIHADGTVSGSMEGSPLTGKIDSNGYLTVATGTDPDFVFTGQISTSGNALSAKGNYKVIGKAHFLIPAGEIRSGDWSATGTTSSEGQAPATVTHAASPPTVHVSAQVKTFKTVKVTHFTHADEPGVPDDDVNALYNSLLKHLQEAGIAGQVVGEEVTVPDVDGAESAVVEGKFTAYRKPVFPVRGRVALEINVYHMSDHALIKSVTPDMVIFGKDRDGIGEWVGGRAAAEIKKVLR